MRRRVANGAGGGPPVFPMVPSDDGFGVGMEDDDADEDMAMCGGGGGGAGEKKRRLSVEQVRALEVSFEKENKLEPERKARLARDLGLQPRQVAVWFQNRRARWKTKQLERDYNALRHSYDALRLDHDALRRDKDALAAEIRELREKLPKPEAAAVKSEACIEAELRQATAVGAAVCNNNKDGSSDSDSSVVFNDEASPCPYSGSAAVFEQPGGGFMGFGAPTFLDSSAAATGGCSSSLLPMLETKWPGAYGSYDAGKSGGGYGFTEEWLAGTDAIGNDAGAGFFADEHVSSLNFGWCGSGAEGFDLHGYCKK